VKALRPLGFGLLLFVLPLLLGYLVVGPRTPVGRNSDSVTGIGHKAFRLLLEAQGWDVQRFGRGVEGLPALGRSAFVAMEPGPLLFREDGAFARPLLRFVEAGNGAVLTLGPDPDRSAESDDRAQIFGTEAGRAIRVARAVEEEARARQNAPVRTSTTPSSVPGPRPTGGPDETDSWPASRLGAFLGLPLSEERLWTRTATLGAELTGPLALGLGESPRLALTRPRVFGPITETSSVSVLLWADRQPLVVGIQRGKGRLVLLAEPRLLHNGAIGRATHARVAVALLDALALKGRARVIHLEEWSHGRADAQNIFGLVAGTRLKWLLLQLALIGGVLVVLVAPPRRRPVPKELPPRRAKHEAIEAVATLQLRAADLNGATAALITLSQRHLGRLLSPGQPLSTEALSVALAQRLGRSEAELQALFDPTVPNLRAFVARARALQALRVQVEAKAASPHRPAA
jgi:hypothetical protein